MTIRLRILLPATDILSSLGASSAAHAGLLASILLLGLYGGPSGPRSSLPKNLLVDLAPARAEAKPQRRVETPPQKKESTPKPKPPPVRKKADAPKTVVEKPQGVTAQPEALPEAEAPPPPPPSAPPEEPVADPPSDLEQALTAVLDGRSSAGIVTEEGFHADWYQQSMMVRLRTAWTEDLVLPAGAEPRRVVIGFRIQRSGAVRDASVAIPSGFGRLDSSALRAVQSIEKFPPLPRSYDENELNVRIIFEVVPPGGR